MKSKILIIEDKKDVNENLATLLEDAGYEVKTVDSGLGKFSLLVLCNTLMLKSDDYVPLDELGSDKTISSICKYCEEKTNKMLSNKHEAISDKILKENSTFFITHDNQPQFLKVNQIKAINTLNQYTTLFVNNNKEITFRKSINAWERILPKPTFLRISRSTIINTNCISKVEKWLQFSYRIYISGIDKPFELSRRYASKIRKQI
jgi:DNA-binding LytR/AlgR family response regulator